MLPENTKDWSNWRAQKIEEGILLEKSLTMTKKLKGCPLVSPGIVC